MGELIYKQFFGRKLYDRNVGNTGLGRGVHVECLSEHTTVPPSPCLIYFTEISVILSQWSNITPIRHIYNLRFCTK